MRKPTTNSTANTMPDRASSRCQEVGRASAGRFEVVRAVAMMYPIASCCRLRTRAPRNRSTIYLSQNRGRPKSLEDQVDTERQLPEGLRNRRDALHGAPALDDVEH